MIYWIIILGLIIGLVVLLFQHKRLKNQSILNINNTRYDDDMRQLQQEKERLNEIINKLKEETLTLKEQFLVEKELAFQKGIQEGVKQSGYEIQVHPYHKAISEKSLFGSKELIEIGYKYILMINGVPALTSHTEILETVAKKDIDEGKVERYLSKIVEVVNALPMNKGKIIGDLATFGKKLLTQGKK